jgi:hypothetical protein
MAANNVSFSDGEPILTDHERLITRVTGQFPFQCVSGEGMIMICSRIVLTHDRAELLFFK